MQKLGGPRETGDTNLVKPEEEIEQTNAPSPKTPALKTDAFIEEPILEGDRDPPMPKTKPSGDAELDLARKIPCAAAFDASSRASAIRAALARQDQAPLTLYRGARSQEGLKPKRLASFDSLESIARAVGSRVMSQSTSISGLTGTPQVAAAFALGVQDADPETIRIHGADKGVVGTVNARCLSAKSFVALVDEFGDREGLAALTSAMAEQIIVVNATALIDLLADRFPGILTRGFREMMDATLSRESEYLIFGSLPEMNQVTEISKEMVVETSVVGSHFSHQLIDALKPPE